MSAAVQRSFVITLGLLIGLSPLAIDLYLPGMPAIGADLAASPAAVAQTLSVYLACFAIPQLIFGPLSDARGRQFTMITGLLIFLAGSAACALAINIEQLILSRGLQGIGAAAIVVTVPALVRDRFKHSDFARIMGVIMMVMALAPLVAPLVGGLILTLGNWRMMFALLAVLALIGLVLFKLQVGETLEAERRIPFRPRTIFRNYRALVSHGETFSFILCAGFAFAGMLAFLSASPFVYIELYGASELEYGLLFACNVITIITFTAIGNRIVRTIGPLRLLGLAMLILLLASLVLAALCFVDEPPLWLVVLSVMTFVGTNGVVSANSMALVMNRFAHISGNASALAGAARFGTGAAGGIAVSILHSTSAVPMLAVMAAFGAGAVLFYGLGTLLRKPADQPKPAGSGG